MAMVTVDDPTRLSPVEATVQALAGRASVYAMLNILTILILDAKILGSLQGQAAGTGKVQFALLLCVVVLKGFLAWRTYSLASDAAAVAEPASERHYLGNARGAKVATLICGVVTACILAFAARMAF